MNLSFFRRSPRRVRIHQAGDLPTIEGILIGSVDNHYRLLKPKVWEAADRSFELSGEAWVPRERVIFLEAVNA